MKKLMKKILTDKKARNTTAMMTFLMTVVVVGAPWQHS
jgi:hypothetical protein